MQRKIVKLTEGQEASQKKRANCPSEGFMVQNRELTHSSKILRQKTSFV